MSARISRLVVTVMLSTLFQAVDSSYYHPSNEAFAQASNRSAKFVWDLSFFIQELGKKIPLHLEILYDREYKDFVSGLMTLLSGKLDGMTIYEHDKSSATINALLKARKDPTILATICSRINHLAMFEMIKTKRLDSHLVTWLLILEGQVEAEFLSSLKNSIFEGNRVLILVEKPNQDLLVVYSQAEVNGTIRFSTRNAWDAEVRRVLPTLVTTRDEDLYSDMKGRLMIAAAVDSPTGIIFGRTLPDGSIEPVGGTSLETIVALGQYLNFTFKVYQPKDGTFGYPQPDGTVTGLIGMVARREAQLAICGIALHYRREEVIDFAYPHEQEHLRIFTRSPKARSRVLAILSPFTSQVWLIIIACTLFMGPVVYADSKIRERLEGRGPLDLEFQFSAFNMFRSIVNQGSGLALRSWSQRFISVSWMLFCFIISALYSGTLTAVLAIPAYEKPIDSLTDLAKAVEDGFTLAVTRDTTNEYVFKEAKEGIYKEVWGLFNHKDRSKSFLAGTQEGVDKVLSEKMAFIGPNTKFRLLAENYGRRKFHFGRDGFFLQSVGASIPPGAPYNQAFSRILLRLNQGGLHRKWEEDSFRKVRKHSAEKEEDSITKPFTLNDLQAAFFLIFIGYLVAALVLVLEIAAFVMYNNYNKG